jgi:uncharacterized protein (DUF1800 family)
MNYFYFFIGTFLIVNSVWSQTYTDYIGVGHSEGIQVTASSNYNRDGWNEIALAENTINGKGMDGRLLETSRFLQQATFGADLDYIEETSQMSFEEWIENQFTIQSPDLSALVDEIYQEAKQMYINTGGDAEEYFGPYLIHFLYAWWQSNIDNEDLLRQRMALALSEILVISWDSNIGDYGVGLGDYYEVLLRNAFGNYRDLLYEVSLHPMMGGYLSHYNNHKTIPAQNIHPDENYAREIMQLFSIGLYKLNVDGTYVLDNNGNRIPTYDNNDIKEFAKIFTGLGPAEVIENPWGVTAEFGVDFWFAIKDTPMQMYDEWHEQGEKQLLDGYTVPSGQSGLDDVNDAIDHLFNHPNVGPFIAKRLIQQLVKSNPTPEYVSRVASAFNNTNGVRGDMKAVIKAILLDNEARSCDWSIHPAQGKLIAPLLRYLNVARQLDKNNSSGLNWNHGYAYYIETGQAPLGSPSVFNFYLPDYSPNGPISDSDLLAPEFQIHNSVTSVAYVNEVDLWTYPNWGYPVLDTWSLGLEGVTLDFDALKYFAQEPEVLVNQLDKIFTRGQLSDETRETIINALTPIQGNDPYVDYNFYRVKMGLHLILISPDYTILK